MTAAAMTAATITDVMLPSFSTILQEFALQIETVVFRICGTASGMDLHGSPHSKPYATGVPPLGLLALSNRPAEIACHLSTVKVGLAMGGASDTEMCRRFCFGGEKPRLTPPNSNYTPKVIANRTIHRIDLVINPAQLANSLNKTK